MRGEAVELGLITLLAKGQTTLSVDFQKIVLFMKMFLLGVGEMTQSVQGLTLKHETPGSDP